jgi:hypothetical protein
VCWEAFSPVHRLQLASLVSPEVLPCPKEGSSKQGREEDDDDWSERQYQKRKFLAFHLWQEPGESFTVFVLRLCDYFHQNVVQLTDQKFIKFTLKNIHQKYLNLRYREYESLEVLIKEAQTIELLRKNHLSQDLEKDEGVAVNKEAEKDGAADKKEDKGDAEVVKVEQLKSSETTTIKEEMVAKAKDEAFLAENDCVREVRLVVNVKQLLDQRNDDFDYFQLFHEKAINILANAAFTIIRTMRHLSHNRMRRNRM